jgi:hypothetical protein
MGFRRRRTNGRSGLHVTRIALILALAGAGGVLAPSALPTGAEPGFSRTAGRPFETSSAWNTPIISNPALDARNSSQVAYLTGFTHPGIANLYAYGVPVWDADASTPKYKVNCRRDWGTCALSLQPVPIPSGAKASSGSDGAMVVIDWSTGAAYEFWKAYKVSSTTWSAAWGGTARIDGMGTPGAAVGAGVSRLAGVVRTHEILRGSIDHALVFSTNNACTGRYKYPASKSDGKSSRSDCIPEGARVQLDPSINVDAISGMTAAERIVARALQKYGAYAIDNGGAPMAFIFETPSGESDPYCSVGLCSDYTALDRIPWNRLRVLDAWDGTQSAPTISVAKVAVTEGNSGTVSAAVPVTLSKAWTSNIAVSFTTTSGTARADVDYVTTLGSVVIPAGATSGTISVAVKGDTLYETTESFTVKISSTDALVAVGSAAVSIKNDDKAPIVSVANVSMAEGNSGTTSMKFTARLSVTTGVACKLTYTTADGTAVAGSDYTSTTGRFTIAAGSTSVQFSVGILGNRTREANETFVVNFTKPSYCTRATNQAVGTIVNDD